MKIGKIVRTKDGICITSKGLFSQSFEIDAPDLVELQKWLLFNLQDIKDQYKREHGVNLNKHTSGMSKFQQ